ncbi:Phospholipase A-2-activating protein-like protein [Drosera capensis]
MELDFLGYKLSCELRGHEDDVRGICVCDNAGIATSSRDRTVRFWPADGSGKYKGSSRKILLGHTSFVGPLAWIPPSGEFPEGGLVSGGMDTLALVWDLRTGEKVQTLKGHKMQVTGLVLDDHDIVSSSVDCTLKRWRNGKSIESWEAHSAAIQAVVKLPSGELVTDTVRGLAVMPDLGILSASHDGSIRLWALTGEVLMEMVGHTSIVYSVDSHATGLVVSGSEDCSAKIWKDGACVQSIDHPGCVWDAKFLANGDLVTACSDGVIRVWTDHEDRIADPIELESYLSVLSAYKGSRKTVGGLKLEELPGLEALKTPGASDGQTKIIREGDNGVAYAWNAREYTWDKIGEVVDGPNDGLKRPVLDGVEYDYVFDVDIGDGEPIRKLPYNRSDDPYSAADKWLLNQNLPLSYRQQIVDFILENTGQKSFAFDSSFCDPFTGCIPSKPTFKHIPKRGMLVFDVAQFDGILKKISEFNSALHSDLGQKQLSLSELEVARLSAVVKILKDTSHYHSSSFADVDVDLLLKVVNVWSLSMIFPVIDMLRMMVLHPDGADKLVKHVDSNGTLLAMIKKVTASPVIPANILTGLRLLVNLFKDFQFHQWLLHNRIEILDAFSSCSTSSNKNVQLAHSTLILNYSVLLIEKKDEEGQSQVLSAALEIAELENIDVDSKFRALVAIGSLMLEGSVKRVALDLDVESIAKAARTSKEAKVAEVAEDIVSLT